MKPSLALIDMKLDVPTRASDPVSVQETLRFRTQTRTALDDPDLTVGAMEGASNLDAILVHSSNKPNANDGAQAQTSSSCRDPAATMKRSVPSEYCDGSSTMLFARTGSGNSERKDQWVLVPHYIQSERQQNQGAVSGTEVPSAMSPWMNRMVRVEYLHPKTGEWMTFISKGKVTRVATDESWLDVEHADRPASVRAYPSTSVTSLSSITKREAMDKTRVSLQSASWSVTRLDSQFSSVSDPDLMICRLPDATRDLRLRYHLRPGTVYWTPHYQLVLSRDLSAVRLLRLAAEITNSTQHTFASLSSLHLSHRGERANTSISSFSESSWTLPRTHMELPAHSKVTHTLLYRKQIPLQSWYRTIWVWNTSDGNRDDRYKEFRRPEQWVQWTTPSSSSSSSATSLVWPAGAAQLYLETSTNSSVRDPPTKDEETDQDPLQWVANDRIPDCAPGDRIRMKLPRPVQSLSTSLQRLLSASSALESDRPVVREVKQQQEDSVRPRSVSDSSASIPPIIIRPQAPSASSSSGVALNNSSNEGSASGNGASPGWTISIQPQSPATAPGSSDDTAVPSTSRNPASPDPFWISFENAASEPMSLPWRVEFQFQHSRSRTFTGLIQSVNVESMQCQDPNWLQRYKPVSIYATKPDRLVVSHLPPECRLQLRIQLWWSP